METTKIEIPGNPDYILSVQLLLKLHNLIAQGKEDSEEAESVRDATEKPWYRLSEAEQTRLRVLSANLDMLINDEAFRPVPPEQRTEGWLREPLKVAEAKEDWDTYLALLRNGPDYIMPDVLAALRGLAYDRLGHSNIALLFLEFAFEKNPTSSAYAFFIMSILLQSHRFSEAEVWADRIIARPTAEPRQMFGALSAIFIIARECPATQAKTKFERVLLLLQQLIKQYVGQGMGELKGLPGLSPHLLLALCYGALNRTHEALDALNMALAFEPNNPYVLKVKSTLTSNSDAETVQRVLWEIGDSIAANTNQFALAA